VTFEASETETVHAVNLVASRLQSIGEQPLGERATSYVELHDSLRVRLEGGDAPSANE
jgi:hypothetical protein